MHTYKSNMTTSKDTSCFRYWKGQLKYLPQWHSLPSENTHHLLTAWDKTRKRVIRKTQLIKINFSVMMVQRYKCFLLQNICRTWRTGWELFQFTYGNLAAGLSYSPNFKKYVYILDRTKQNKDLPSFMMTRQELERTIVLSLYCSFDGHWRVWGIC